MKTLIQKIVQAEAQAILKKYQPKIVAVTGSVGKTSTRNAIAVVLAERFRVRTAAHNYNNEFGVPLTVLGVDSAGKSVLGWLSIMWQGLKMLVSNKIAYPNLLVLEYGADKPGDIAALCRFARPEVAVWTAVSPVHVANFPSLEKLIDEKQEIIKMVNPNGLVILNGDEAEVMKRRAQAAAPVCTYGFSADADVRAENYAMDFKEDASFQPDETFAHLTMDIVYRQNPVPISVPNLVGRPQASAALAAAAVGLHFGLSLEEIAKRLALLQPEIGRMHPVAGIKGCLILDDSYNAAPASTKAALETLAAWPIEEQSRRIAVLGAMAELGNLSAHEHRLIGMQAATVVDVLVTSGELAKDMARGAREAGMDEKDIVEAKDAIAAGRWLDAHVKPGDIILVKGSQSARMEKAAKDILAEPSRAAELLPRMTGKWLED